MNMIAIDIGNTSITAALYLNDEEKLIETIRGRAEDARQKLTDLLTDSWQRVPFVEGASPPRRNGVIVASSVNPAWTDIVADICRNCLNEKLKVIGKDVPLPIDTAVDNAMEVGTDRLVAAAAAFAVVEDAVVVADFGTAVTIDLVDENGTFMGGVIYPGFDILAKALHENTAKLPSVHCKRPKGSYGSNTVEAINAGMYYGAIGLLETITRKYAEEIGKWPQLIVTGGAARVIKEDCQFVDTWVSNLTVRGVVIAWKKYIEDQAYLAELGEQEEQEK
ncbi:MAG TPA: type III pantothenate kinase [Anaerohalosphaeraceae bacterium]|jgi:type III pantothenate kinase|nr:type III pantothenate kinase [Anaerohalosphaeraceae bacterium]HRT50030.1 type III pantothenate kinase [Anaerohalosphaeraceae bacterium]HRT85833.1 type III pantothenate kinase [Anaerohalosphaeraceae bacterium]